MSTFKLSDNTVNAILKEEVDLYDLIAGRDSITEPGRVQGECKMVDKEQIRKILKQYYKVAMKQVTIHDDGVVDVRGNVALNTKMKTKSLMIQFGEVGGNFYCSFNQLTSLAGAPTEVGGNFDCSYNQLTSLAGAPREVGGNFDCDNNQLTSLAGAPKEVGGYFDCSLNQLTSLAGAPKEVGGYFTCWDNQLTSLAGAPHKVGGGFNCTGNQLKSLAGAPSEVGGKFSCYRNQLKSLAGAPHKVGGDFDCAANQLTSLEGAPHKVGGVFNCAFNQLTSLEGAPERIGHRIWLSYSAKLPLLRCLVATRIEMYDAPRDVKKIMNDPRWKRKGKKGSLMCADELIRAGFEGNARW